MTRPAALAALLLTACSATGLLDGDGAAPIDTAAPPDASTECAPECELESGEVCRDGACVAACADPSNGHLGCSFWAVDLDNGVFFTPGAASQLHGVIVTNPWPITVRVWIEQNEAPFGEPPDIRELTSVLVPARDHEAIPLPSREVDGSSPGGFNDGTHTAISSNAYRVRSDLPIAVVQANPMDIGGFSADTALLLPAHLLGRSYTVVGWPQTIADGDTPETDYDPARTDEDQRAFLTVVGTVPDTRVRVTLGEIGERNAHVVAGGPIPMLDDGDVFEIDLGPFDVLNLETEGLNADFTGSTVEADFRVVVFSGSEASDAPRFESYADRICCADHLEEQLLPDRLAGRHFVIGRQHPRRPALGRARGISTPTVEEREWVRVLGVAPVSTLETDLPELPASLIRGEDVIVEIDRSFELRVTNLEGAVQVLSILGAQDAIGVAGTLLGGDPSTLTVPPVDAYSRVTWTSVPETYSFDFVTITAPADAVVELDGVALADRTAPDGTPACRHEDASPRWVVHQCQISFPQISGDFRTIIDRGLQDDGAHLVTADRPVGVSVSGFERYAGYAHLGGLGSVP